MALSNTYKSITQPSTINNRSLVFAYPFVMDKNLEMKYGEILRDFFSIQFVNQIKESSIINITMSATSAGQYTLDNEHINPAETLAKSLGQLQPNPTQTPQYNINAIDKREYQEKIYQFQRFIQNQISNDPRYSDLNSLISTVTVENLLDIPLIIGTKKYGIESDALFWLLFIATGALNPTTKSSIELNEVSALKKIDQILYRIDKNNYNQFFSLSVPNSDKPSPGKFENVLNTPDKLSRALKTFNYVLDRNQWQNQLAINPTNSFTVSIIKTIEENPHLSINALNNSATLFTGVFAEDIVPILQSTLHIALGAGEEANYGRWMNNTTDSCLAAARKIFSDISQSIDSSYSELDKDGNISERNESQLEQLFAIQDRMCEINDKIAVNSILFRLKSVYFSMKSNNEAFYDFVENLDIIGAQINAYVNQLTDCIVQLGTDRERVKNLLNSYDTKLREIFNDFYQNVIPDQLGTSNRIFNILNVNSFSIPTFINNVVNNLTNITRFLALYIYFSYNCEYLSQIRAKIDVAKNNAVQFPNYCLVLNAQTVYKIYMAMALATLKKMREDETQQNTQFKVTEQHIINMVRVLSDQLKIPNIIVVDEKSQVIYYRWMFHPSGSFSRMSISNLPNYIKSQKDILPSI